MYLERSSAQTTIPNPGVNEDLALGYIFDHNFAVAAGLISGELHLAIGSRAHILKDDKVVNRLPIVRYSRYMWWRMF